MPGKTVYFSEFLLSKGREYTADNGFCRLWPRSLTSVIMEQRRVARPNNRPQLNWTGLRLTWLPSLQWTKKKFICIYIVNGNAGKAVKEREMVERKKHVREAWEKEMLERAQDENKWHWKRRNAEKNCSSKEFSELEKEETCKNKNNVSFNVSFGILGDEITIKQCREERQNQGLVLGH